MDSLKNTAIIPLDEYQKLYDVGRNYDKYLMYDRREETYVFKGKDEAIAEVVESNQKLIEKIDSERLNFYNQKEEMKKKVNDKINIALTLSPNKELRSFLEKCLYKID
jgi:hypothetical protein